MTKNQQNLLIVVVILCLISLCMFAYTGGCGIGRLTRNVSNTDDEPLIANSSQNSKPSISPSTSEVSETTKVQVDQKIYHRGYDAGVKEGKVWANMKEIEAMPLPVVINALGKQQGEEVKTQDLISWNSGFLDGFEKGFKSIRGGVSASDYEPISRQNVKVNEKLYNNLGKYVATVIAVDTEGGIITVKYSADRGSAVERKDINALSQFWFVHK